MILWKMIWTFVAIIPLLASQPVYPNGCNEKTILCGEKYENFIKELCKINYFECLLEDDDVPEHEWQVADKCCKTGCDVAFLKMFYCKDHRSITTSKYDEDLSRGSPILDKNYPPMGSEMIRESANVPHNMWPYNSFPLEQQSPFYQ